MSTRFLIYLALLAWNLAVFVTYGIDKRRARRGMWRISEKTLLLESLFGGGLGAFLAGQIFHHKTRKWYFRLIWFLGILLDCLVIYLVWRIKNEWKINF